MTYMDIQPFEGRTGVVLSGLDVMVVIRGTQQNHC